LDDSFLTLASRLLLGSMIPLAAGISLDFYIIGRLILHRQDVSVVFALILFAILTSLWLFLPRLKMK
jgi:hypothetical protein